MNKAHMLTAEKQITGECGMTSAIPSDIATAYAKYIILEIMEIASRDEVTIDFLSAHRLWGYVRNIEPLRLFRDEARLVASWETLVILLGDRPEAETEALVIQRYKDARSRGESFWERVRPAIDYALTAVRYAFVEAGYTDMADLLEDSNLYPAKMERIIEDAGLSDFYNNIFECPLDIAYCCMTGEDRKELRFLYEAYKHQGFLVPQ